MVKICGFEVIKPSFWTKHFEWRTLRLLFEQAVETQILLCCSSTVVEFCYYLWKTVVTFVCSFVILGNIFVLSKDTFMMCFVFVEWVVDYGPELSFKQGGSVVLLFGLREGKKKPNQNKPRKHPTQQQKSPPNPFKPKSLS